jgi:hypothetical protein
MSDPVRETREQDEWASGWEAHRKDQLVIGLSATPAQRIAWLVAMMELAWRTGALPRPHPESGLWRAATPERIDPSNQPR